MSFLPIFLFIVNYFLLIFLFTVVIEIEGGPNHIHCCFPGHCLSEQTMDVAVPMIMLQHYVNPCLHYLIGPAMVTLVMCHLGNAVEILRSRYHRPHIYEGVSKSFQTELITK
jgi:hypothetical protein